MIEDRTIVQIKEEGGYETEFLFVLDNYYNIDEGVAKGEGCLYFDRDFEDRGIYIMLRRNKCTRDLEFVGTVYSNVQDGMELTNGFYWNYVEDEGEEL